MNQSLHRASPDNWLKKLASPETRIQVEIGRVPVRFHPPPDWDTRTLKLEEHLLYFFAQETAQAEIAGASFLCPRGSCCWITPGTSFRFHSKQSPLVWRFRFTVIEGNKKRLAPKQPYYFLSNNSALAETVNALLGEIMHEEKWRSESLRAWLMQLSILFFRATRKPEPRTLTAVQQAALQHLLETAPPDRFLRSRELARAASLSPDYFSRVFHRTHGLSPKEWLVRQRLAHAIVLLQETSLRIGEIAQRLGYANPHLFPRQFTARFGRSPRSFRS